MTTVKIESTPMANHYEKRLIRVVDYIHDNPAGNLSLDTLADVAALSRFHFHRMFRNQFGETVTLTVRRVRLHLASVALVRGADPIERIAISVGYPNLASFSRAFRELYSVTPAAFRKRGQLCATPLSTTRKAIPMFPTEIRNSPARHIAAITHKGAYFEISRAFQKLSTTLAARDMFKHSGAMVAVFYDDPASTHVSDLRSHAGFEMATDVEVASPLEIVDLPGGRHAVLTFKGPYAGLPEAYDHLYGAWLRDAGETPANSPSFEIYLNSPMDTAPDNLLTELHLPLA